MCHSHSASQSKRVFVNILRGQIVQIVPQENRIDIAVLVEGHKVWASISKWAFNELHFAQGMDVYVQIKAISVV